jgi:hypothetical protein
MAPYKSEPVRYVPTDNTAMLPGGQKLSCHESGLSSSIRGKAFAKASHPSRSSLKNIGPPLDKLSNCGEYKIENLKQTRQKMSEVTNASEALEIFDNQYIILLSFKISSN